MQTVNEKSATILKQLIDMCENSDGHIKLQNNTAFMPLCAEIIGRDIKMSGSPHSFNEISLAHYGVQNGDLMSDPEMTILYTTIQNELFIFPTSYTQHYLGIYRVSVLNDNGTWKINKKEQASQTEFLNDWLLNIKNQQNI